MNKKIGLIIGVMSLLLVSACSNSDNSTEPNVTSPATAETAPPQPVTLKVGINSTFDDEEMTRYISDPLKKKYPHITIERINVQEKGLTIAELIAAGSIPDIYSNYILSMYSTMVDNGTSYNIDSLLKKYNVDLSRLKPEFVSSMLEVTQLKYHIGVPIFNNTFGLFYNKGLFDRFGVPYPKDGMTWDEIDVLSKRLARIDNGTQYFGLWPDNIFRGAYQASLPYVDLVNDKPPFQTGDGWKNLFQLWHKLYDVPGVGTLPLEFNNFKSFTDGRIAMASGYAGQLQTLAGLKDFNWDVVTYPTNSAAPGVGQRVDTFVLNITNQSKYKDAAAQLLSVLLSDEVQTDISRHSMVSVLKDEKVHAEYAKATPELQSKNVVAFTKLKAADLKPMGYVAPSPVTPVNTIFTNFRTSGTDVNTALREADEVTAKLIAESIQNKKK